MSDREQLSDELREERERVEQLSFDMTSFRASDAAKVFTDEEHRQILCIEMAADILCCELSQTIRKLSQEREDES